MKLIRLSCLCLLGSAIITSCVKQAFDIPPDASKYDPQLPVNAKVGDLAMMAAYLPMDSSKVIGDTVISGIVIGDDRSGNIYKKIIIQDTAGGGITVMIDKTYLYGDYPVGRRIYIKAKGLYVTNYRGMPEITYSLNPDGSANGIPAAVVNDFIVKGAYPVTLTPQEITTTDLFSNPQKYLNTLVRLNDMQFDASSANVVYSSPVASTNRTIVNCNQTVRLTMYNSSYSTFQPALTPNGKGSIDGIVSIYRSTVQFVLRDTADVHFTEPRCQ